MSKRRWLAATGGIAVAVVVAFAVVAEAMSGSSPARKPSAAVSVTIEGSPPGRPLAAGFLGLSFELPGLSAYTGLSQNPVLEQLIRQLAPGQAPVLRLGGDTTDMTWWPVRGIRRPPGVTFTLTPQWLQSTRQLAQALDAHLIIGVNLEANRRALAAAEARALVAGIGRQHVEALEIGNEPNVYAIRPWYVTRGNRPVPGRPRSYDFADFIAQFARFSRVLPAVPLAGPAITQDASVGQFARFVAAAPRLAIATVHHYPLNSCVDDPQAPSYATIGNLLAPFATGAGLIGGLAAEVQIAHRHGVSLRVDEMNSAACGGRPGVSDTFASALWVLRALFVLDQLGVDGVNLHTSPGASYQLFTFQHTGSAWSAAVAPEYYGALMFAQAAAPGSRLLTLAGPTPAGLSRWATVDPDGSVRVVVINSDLGHARVVAIRLRSSRRALLTRLRAPSVTAESGITFGGQSFGADTTSGRLVGSVHGQNVVPRGGTYTVTVPPASAALLAIGAGAKPGVR